MRHAKSCARPRKSLARPSERWRDSARLLPMLTVVSILMIALCFTGCATSRKTSSQLVSSTAQESVDSLRYEVRKIETVTVPLSQVILEIPIDSLRKLPQKAEYRAKSGQANAVVQYRQDTIVVYSICDSLKTQCEYYESMATTYKQAYEDLQDLVREEKEHRSNPIKTALISFLVGVVIGILLTIIVKLKFRIL